MNKEKELPATISVSTLDLISPAVSILVMIGDACYQSGGEELVRRVYQQIDRTVFLVLQELHTLQKRRAG